VFLVIYVALCLTVRAQQLVPGLNVGGGGFTGSTSSEPTGENEQQFATWPEYQDPETYRDPIYPPYWMMTGFSESSRKPDYLPSWTGIAKGRPWVQMWPTYTGHDGNRFQPAQLPFRVQLDEEALLGERAKLDVLLQDQIKYADGRARPFVKSYRYTNPTTGNIHFRDMRTMQLIGSARSNGDKAGGIPIQYHRNDASVQKQDYRIGIILDPCRNRKFDCCVDVYGAPEYYDPTTDTLYNEERHLINAKNSRLADMIKEITTKDNECYMNITTRNYDRRNLIRLPDGNITYSYAYDDRTCDAPMISKYPWSMYPACWDFNMSVTSARFTSDFTPPDFQYCMDTNGASHRSCVTIGFTQTTFVVSCRNKEDSDWDCGTFVELHFPFDERLLAEQKLPGSYPSGYKVINMPLTYFGNPDRVVCAGDYELWWVLRTRSENIVEYRKPFRITYPPCAFSRLHNEYSEFYDFAEVAAELAAQAAAVAQNNTNG
jgi:hypothetical protein